MFITILCVALISLTVGCVIGWICGVRAASGKQTQLRRDVSDLLGDVRTLKADAAKVQVCAEENTLEQRRLRAAAEMARAEAAKAANVIRDIKPALRVIRTHKRIY